MTPSPSVPILELCAAIPAALYSEGDCMTIELDDPIGPEFDGGQPSSYGIATRIAAFLRAVDLRAQRDPNRAIVTVTGPRGEQYRVTVERVQ